MDTADPGIQLVYIIVFTYLTIGSTISREEEFSLFMNTDLTR